MALASSAILSAGALALGAVGTGISYMGQKAQAAASAAAEKLRKRQMELEATRQRRAAIRESLIARATAVSNATNQGAQESSSLEGGIAQVTGQRNQNIKDVNQSEEIGSGIFSANERYAKAGATVAMGNAFQGVSGQVLNNLPTITRVGQFVTRV